MSAKFSTLARNGSHTSSSSGSSADVFSNNHTFSRVRTYTLPVWLQDINRYEQLATGTLRLGMAVLTREMMEMHVQQAPDARGMLDCLPVADRQDAVFIGWRRKLTTWPVPKNEALTSRWW